MLDDDVQEDDGQVDDFERGCSICDAPGHGYPGARPCPLEWGDGYYDPREAELEMYDPLLNYLSR